MPFLPSRHYQSDYDQFLQQLKAQHPEIPEQQREARAIWWDKSPSALELRRQMDIGRVPPRAYVYQTE